MAAANKFENFTEDLAGGIHSLGATQDVLKIYLSNAAPNAATNEVKGDVLEIAAGNGYAAGGEDTQNAISRTGGTTTITGVDVLWTAAAGTIGPFRYVPLYNDTPTSPADPLIQWWDYGSSITLQDGESFAVDFTGDSLMTFA